jgi:CheY-like chemotaxis protein
MNLVTNAFQAMRETGGTLEIELDEIGIGGERTADHPELARGRYAHLRFRDTGHGMDELTRTRIFEPYFTTRKAGEGTGLGLATVHGIVSGLEGAIDVESTPGEGSTLHVFLPISKHDDEVHHEKSGSKVRVGGTEKILVVDDEDSLVRLTALVLEDLGYEVDGYTDSIDALGAFIADPEEYDLVITDLTMPQMTGLELSARFLEHRPGIPIILCTGLSDAIDEDMARSHGVSELIQKPVLASMLSRTVRKTLDS